MAHGDTQRRGGELGDSSTLLDAQIDEAGVGLDAAAVQALIDVHTGDATAAHAATAVSYDDSGHGTKVAGANVQLAIVSIADEFETPTHVHAGGAGQTVSAIAVDVSLAGSATEIWPIAGASGDVVMVDGIWRVTAVQAADAFTVTVAGCSVVGMEGWNNDGANDPTVIKVGGTNMTLPPTGSGQDSFIHWSAVCVMNSVSCSIKLHNATATRGVLKKGSIIRYSKT